jgi:high affinity choline transporter 7
MYLQKYSKLLPTVFLLIFLVACGLYLFVTGASVMWSGFIAMMFFYALIFYFGSYVAGNQKVKDGNDTMLAGRSIPLFIGIFTMSATWVGGGYINGTAESAKTGLVWVQAPWGYAISLIIGGLFFARIMRRHQFKTMLDPLSQRFGKRMAALLFIPALSGEIFWTAAILTALGTTFGTVLGLEAQPAIILSAIIAIAYTSIGGLWAVALTDVVQLVLLLGGLALVVPIAMSYCDLLSKS